MSSASPSCPTCNTRVDLPDDLMHCPAHPWAAKHCLYCVCPICAMNKKAGLGATGEFPQGEVHPSDEGELKLAVGHHVGKVFLSFGKPVGWFAGDPKMMRELGTKIIEACDQVSQEGGD